MLADLFLDTLPYKRTRRRADALWAWGSPSITAQGALRGPGRREPAASGGLTELIAEVLGGFMKHGAEAWAHDASALPAVKAKLAANRETPCSFRYCEIYAAISKRPISHYGSASQNVAKKLSDRKARHFLPSSHRKNTGDRRAIFHSKKRFVQIGDVEAGGSRCFAHMIGVMAHSGRVRQMKRDTIAGVHAQCENAAGLSRLARRPRSG